MRGTTTIYVTHNLAEAVRLGHRVVVLSRRPGRVREIVEIDRPVAGRAEDDKELLGVQARLWQSDPRRRGGGGTGVGSLPELAGPVPFRARGFEPRTVPAAAAGTLLGLVALWQAGASAGVISTQFLPAPAGDRAGAGAARRSAASCGSTSARRCSGC